MTTAKDRPGESNPVEQTEAFEIAAMNDPGIGRVELAQSGVTPIEVPRPSAGQTLNITVVAGRPLKLEFNAADVKAREVVKDDLILEFDNGGKIVLKEYMTAFGMLGEVRTTIIQPDGKHYAFTELLSPTAGPRANERPAPGTPGDVVIIQKPHAGDTQHFKLTDQKPMALNFGFGEVSKSHVDKDGSLILTFKDGAVLVLEGYSALKDNKSIGLYFAKGDKIALADLAPGAGPDEGAEGGRLFTEFAPGGTLPGLDHLGPLPPLPFTLIPPPGPPGSPPGSPPPPPPPPPEGEGPTYFIKGPDCLIEEVDPQYTFGVTNVSLQAGQTRSIDIHVEFAAQQPGHGAASFDDFVGGANFLFDAIAAAAAGETGITVTDLGNGAVRVTFAANASTNQLTFNILAVDDGIDEPIEDFRFVLSNEQVTSGATPGTIVVGPGTSFVDSQLLDLDEHQVTISDAVGNEGDKLVFDVHLSNPIDEDLPLDLEAQPLVTVNTNAATPGVDFEAGNFEYSIDGGVTWLAADGPNGTVVTIPQGTTDIKVRIETFTDGATEGDESFLLTVANLDELDHCDVTNVVNGAGYIFDGQNNLEGPTYFINGPECLIESVDPTFTFGVSQLVLDPGQTRSIDIHVEFDTVQAGHGTASFDDFVGGASFLFDAISAAATSESGITVTDLGNGAVRVTFAADASTNQLSFDVLAVDDGIDEPIEDFTFVLGNEQVTGGAVPGTVVPGEGTSFVNSQILDPDEHQITISDAVGFEGDQLVFDVALSNAVADPIELDLAVQPLSTVDTNAATPGVDFAAGNFEYSIDGGATWLDATGPNGTIVTIPAGVTDIKVRIGTFTDGVLEGDESFLLTVANRDQLDHCDVTKIVEGAGYIFDSGDCNAPPPEWFVCGPPCLIEEVDPTYTIGISDLALQVGQTRSIDVRVDFASFHNGHDAASFADLGGNGFLFDALSDAATNETGITVADLGNGTVRVTFAADASTTQLAFDLLPVQDDIDENIEDFRIVLENSQATNGAQPGVIVPGEGSSFVTSHIVESDEYSVVIGDDCGCPPDENTPPQADDDSASTCGTPVTIAVLANDSDREGDALWVEAFTDAANGTLVLNSDGTFTYTPVANFTGTDSFSYAVGDGNGSSDTAVVTITVRDGEVCDCDIPPPPCDMPPPPDCDGPRRDWSNTRGNWSGSNQTGATHAAFAALIGLPMAEEWQRENHDSDQHNRRGGDDHRHGGQSEVASGPGDEAGGGWSWPNGPDDRGGRNGSDGESGHSGGWKWTNWDDRGGSHESHFGNTQSDNRSSGWQTAHDGGPKSDAGDGPHSTPFAAAAETGGAGANEAAGKPVISGTAGDDTLHGTAAAELLIGGAGNDVIYGGGGADVLRGGAGDDALVAKAGFAEIHGGAGIDIFEFDDSGVLDLSQLSGKVTGVEKADITGTGNVELKLTVQDLLTMTDSGHQLAIVGDSGDKVSADLSGHSVAVTDMGTFTRYVIDGGAATLDIDNHVQKNIIGI
ncbi:MAG TPA: cadherin-like domain-containing protein [Alphaproteobacteria bacterium]|jgi:hypothetical protein